MSYTFFYLGACFSESIINVGHFAKMFVYACAIENKMRPNMIM